MNSFFIDINSDQCYHLSEVMLSSTTLSNAEIAIHFGFIFVSLSFQYTKIIDIVLCLVNEFDRD